MTRDVVPTSPDREQQPVLPSQVDAVDDVGFARAPDDKARPAIDREVLDHPDLVVLGVAGSNDRPAEQHAELGELLVAEIHRPARSGCCE